MQARRFKALARFGTVALVSLAVTFSGGATTPKAAAAVVEPKLKSATELSALDTPKQNTPKPEALSGDFNGGSTPDGSKAKVQDTPARTLTDSARAAEKGTLVSQTQTADVYRKPNGLLVSEQHTKPVNKKDASGKWSKIDTRVVDLGAGTKGVDLGNFKANFSDRLDGSPSLSVNANNDKPIAFAPIGSDPKSVAVTTGNSVLYPSALGDADLSYSVDTNHVSEHITLKKAPMGAAVYKFSLNAEGYTISQNDAKQFVFSLDGVPTFTIPQGVVTDAKGISTAVKVTIDNGVITQTVDSQWLADPSRAYPVDVDPDVWYIGRETNGGETDVQVASSAPNSYFNGASQIDGNAAVNRVGYNSGTEFKAALKFDLQSYVGKDVVGALLETKTYSVGANNCAFVWPASDAWTETTTTFNHFPNHYNDNQVFYGTPNQWSQINVTDWVSNWLENGTWANNGFVFDTAGNDCYVRMASEEQTNATIHDDPVIDVLYHEKASASTTVSPADGAPLQTLTPTLTATTATAADGGQVKYWFRVSDSTDPEIGAIISSGWQTSPTWTIPTGVLKDGVTYSWYVQTGTLTNTTNDARFRQQNEFQVNALSNKVKFKVNLRLGDQTASPDDTEGPVTVNLTNGNVYTSTSSPSFNTVGGSSGLSYAYNSQAPFEMGLKSNYWSNCLGPDRVPPAQAGVIRLDTQINFSWGTGTPADGITPDDFCDTHTGVVTPYVSGNYCFDAVSDDGARVWIGGTQVVSRWTDGATQTPDFSASHCVNINGQASIHIDHYDATGGSHLILYVKDFNGGSGIVPASWLTPGPRSLPRGWTVSADNDTSLAYVKATVTTGSVVLLDSSGVTHEFKRNDINNANSGFTSPEDDKSVVAVQPDGSYRVSAEDGMLYAFDFTGNLLWARSAIDDRAPAAAQYEYQAADGLARLWHVIDPVTARQHTLNYSNGANCAGPTGFDTQAPAGMLCSVSYWDTTTTSFAYKNGQLARIVDPGNSIVGYKTTLFGYDANGNLLTVRDPLQSDWLANNTGVPATKDRTNTHINYTGTKAQSVVTASPVPSSGSTDNADDNFATTGSSITPRPFHRYEYLTNESRVYINGITPDANGWDRKVTYNQYAQTLTETGTDRVVTENEWDLGDHLLRTKNQSTGRQSTTLYDDKGNVTDSYGPAPYQCFQANRLPITAGVTGCTNPSVAAHTHTNYDEGINGLSYTWWDNENLSFAPVKHSTTIRSDNGSDPASVWPAINPFVNKDDNWSVRGTGSINLASLGSYQIGGDFDDGVRIWVDDRLIVDRWAAGSGSIFGTFNNTSIGWHRIRIDFRELGGSATLVMQWAPPGSSVSGVTGTSLRPDYNLATSSVVDDSTTGSPSKKTSTSYTDNGWDATYGLATSTTEDPAGLALKTSTTYEAPSATTYLRPLNRMLPSGNSYNSYTSAYYAAGDAVDAYCSPAPASVQKGYLKTKTYPLAKGQTAATQRVDHFAYDARGRVVCSRTNNEASASTTYDDRGRITSQFKPEPITGSPYAGRTVTYNYAVGADPLTSSISDNKGTITSVTDLLGRVTSYTDVWGRTTTYSYDLAGRSTGSISWGDYRSTTYLANGHVNQQLVGYDVPSMKPVAVPTYSSAGEVTSVVYPDGAATPSGNSNGTSVAIGYDPTGKTNSLTYKKGTTTLSSDAVTYSQSGEIVDQSIDGTDARPAGNNFTYDAIGRLVTAYVPGHTYTYAFAAPDPVACPNGTGEAGGAGQNSNRSSWTDNGTVIAKNCYDTADRLIKTTDTRYSSAIAYDDHGNTTALGGQTMTYDLADRHMSTVAAGATITYTRDATDRIISRTVGSSTTRYSYSGVGDSADMVLNTSNSVIDKMVDLIGGVTKDTQLTGTSTYTDKYSYPNIHGDIVVTADSAGTKQGSTFTYDPFGQALTTIVDNLTSNMDEGWLGSKDRFTEHEGLVQTIEMGQRQYVPGIGRFIEVDPIQGGSANDYDYCNGSPTLCVDIAGTFAFKKAAKSAANGLRNQATTFIRLNVSIQVFYAKQLLVPSAYYFVGSTAFTIGSNIGFFAGAATGNAYAALGGLAVGGAAGLYAGYRFKTATAPKVNGWLDGVNRKYGL